MNSQAPAWAVSQHQNSKDQGTRDQAQRGEAALSLWPSPHSIPRKHTRDGPCGCLSHRGLCPAPHPALGHPGQTGNPLAALGLGAPSTTEGAGRGGFQEPPGPEMPGFSAPMDGKPGNRDSQVGSVWRGDAARKMCWWALAPGPAAAQRLAWVTPGRVQLGTEGANTKESPLRGASPQLQSLSLSRHHCVSMTC